MNKSCYEEVCNRLRKLAQHNETVSQLPELEEYIRKNFDLFAKDYGGTSHNARYSTGKLEGELFLKLASICNFKNRDDNAKEASDIFRLLGYESYKQKPNRFRQKIENYKKKLKSKSGRSSTARAIRRPTRRRVVVEKTVSVPSSPEVDESYTRSSLSDTESISTNSEEESQPPKSTTENSEEDDSTDSSKLIEYVKYLDQPYDQYMFWKSSGSNSLFVPEGDFILSADTSTLNGLYNTDVELAVQEQFAEEHKITFSTILNSEENHNSTFSDDTNVYIFPFF